MDRISIMTNRGLLETFLTISVTLFVSLHFCNGELEPVTLASTLKQPSLCPNETSVTFVCTTRNLRVQWRVDNRDIVLDSDVVELGEIRRVNGYIGTLLRCSEEEGCISTFNILTSNRIEKEVQCYNGSESTIQTVRYSHRVSDPPSPPDNFMEETLDENTVRLSWSSRNSESELSHYIVQLDGADPLLIKNSSMNIPSGVAHTVQLYAVNKCGQSSNVTTSVIQSSTTPPPTTPSTTVTTPTLTTPTISSDTTDSVVQSTGYPKGIASSTVIGAIIALILICFVLMLLLGIAFAYIIVRTKRPRNQQKELESNQQVEEINLQPKQRVEKEPQPPSLPQPHAQHSPQDSLPQDSPERPGGESNISTRSTKCTP